MGIAVSGDVGVKMVVAKMRLSFLSDLALPMFGGIPHPPDSLVSCLRDTSKLSGALGMVCCKRYQICRGICEHIVA